VFHNVAQKLTANTKQQGTELGRQRRRLMVADNIAANAMFFLQPLPKTLEGRDKSQLVEERRAQIERERTRGLDSLIQ
jgi:hypothetical protein